MCAELFFQEASALTGENVNETFVECAKTIVTRVESGARRVAHVSEKRRAAHS